MIIGVIIPTMGLQEKLFRCLENLKKTVLEPTDQMHVVVVDNNSDNKGRSTKEVFDVVDVDYSYYLYCPWNTGFARGSNCGAGIVGMVDAFLFLNNDCYVDPDCIANMMDSMKQGKGDVIGANLRFPDGKIQHAGGIIDSGYGRVYHASHEEYDEETVPGSRHVPWVTGACMLVKADVFWSAGGFGEGYFNGCEDVDLCMKIILLGSKVYYEEKATAIHEEAQTPGRKDHEEKNYHTFIKKWHGHPVETFTEHAK